MQAMTKFRHILASSLVAIVALPHSARAETIEKQFDDFFRQQEKFTAEDRKKREEGYVLQRFYDPAGSRSGQLSLGGGPDPDPVYGAPTNFNFQGRQYDQEEGGILNLRLKF
ncbi:MAG: hypothetical protein HKN11_17440 [Rhizobiales bacterium]|nr:hypothetical protein [Hyphomicrobiales bacterium]